MCGQPIPVINVITKGKGKRTEAGGRSLQQGREREIKYTRADTHIFARKEEEEEDAAKCEMYGAF